MIEAVVVDPSEVPTYRRIAARARKLRELGMSDRAIARSLGVSGKTIAKAIRLEALRDQVASAVAGRVCRVRRPAPCGEALGAAI